MHLNPRVVATSAPPIPAVQGWMREYDNRAGPLIDLCQAVPGYPPPPALLDRLGREAATPGNARYGAILGEPALREATAAHLAALYDAPVHAGNVAITAGCNQAFFAAISANTSFEALKQASSTASEKGTGSAPPMAMRRSAGGFMMS